MQPLKVQGGAASLSEKFGNNGTRLGYVIDETTANALSFYVPSVVRDNLKVALNRDHNFYQKVYQPLLGEGQVEAALALEHLQLLLLAAARAECALRSKVDKEVAVRLREGWSNVLTAFLD
jgi:hypothetical protein